MFLFLFFYTVFLQKSDNLDDKLKPKRTRKKTTKQRLAVPDGLKFKLLILVLSLFILSCDEGSSSKPVDFQLPEVSPRQTYQCFPTVDNMARYISC